MIDKNISFPHLIYDHRVNRNRALAKYYQDIIGSLDKHNVKYIDKVKDYLNFPLYNTVVDVDNLRDYQKEALDRWNRNNKRGCIVLPTGAGKTIIALNAIIQTNSSTLIIVPTINLMEQWRDSIKKILKDHSLIGMLGGGHEDIKMITITTYDSAYLKSSYLGNKFEFLIFDEVHHLASEKYCLIAESFISPYRLGLTATLEREDGRHVILYELVGDVIYEKDFYELAEKNYLANFVIKKRTINMLPEEIIKYNGKIKQYKKLLRSSNIFYPIKLEKLVILSANNINLRNALLLRNEAIEIALNSKAKILELEKILTNIDLERKKILIFTAYTKLAYAISDRFLIPVITHRTKNEERADILENFRNNQYKIIVTTKVLDEGTDVSDVNLGIILSGSGSKREFVQRLGRLLRPKNNKEDVAELIEIVSSDTSEIYSSNKRNTGVKRSIK